MMNDIISFLNKTLRVWSSQRLTPCWRLVGYRRIWGNSATIMLTSENSVERGSTSTYEVFARQGNIPMTSTELMDGHQCISKERDAAVVLDSAVTCQWWMSWFWCIFPLWLARIWANLLRFCFLKLFSLIHLTTLVQKQSEHPHVTTTLQSLFGWLENFDRNNFKSMRISLVLWSFMVCWLCLSLWRVATVRRLEVEALTHYHGVCMHELHVISTHICSPCASVGCNPHVCVSASAPPPPLPSTRVWVCVCVWVDSSSRLTSCKPWNKLVCDRRRDLWWLYPGGKQRKARNGTKTWIPMNYSRNSSGVHFPKPHLMACRW